MEDKISHSFLLSRSLLIGLLLVYISVMLLHASHLTLWMWAIFGLVVVWRINILREVWNQPRSVIKACLLMLVVALLYVEYSQWFSIEPMISLLLSALTLKLIEIRSQRDILFALFLSYFAIACSFLFSQSVLQTALGIVAVILTTAVLIQSYRAQSSLKKSLALASKMLLQSAILAVVMMLVLPRLNPLWSVPLKSGEAITGISDSMSPGDFDQLIQSNKLALRVTFADKDNTISREQMYWRGLVFDDFDGRRWQRSDPINQTVAQLLRFPQLRASNDSGSNDSGSDANNESHSKQNNTIHYDVLMESTGNQWLYGVPVVTIDRSSEKIVYSRQHETFQKAPIDQRIRYAAVSSLNGKIPAKQLTRREYQRYTYLPRGSNPEASKQALQWYQQANSQRAYINNVLQYYRDNFTYTLSPPKLGQHTVDEFLFSTQQGFCEHFSSSFVVLMRSVGIPARVVVGYQGGTWNEDNTYVSVYQRDAHAWAEVWLNDGWYRIDPTAAVAAIRVEQGVAAALPAAESALVGGNRYSFAWLTRLHNRWQVLDYSWQRWVLGYDAKQQQSFLSKYLGDLTSAKLMLLLLIPFSITALIINFGLLRVYFQPVKKEYKAYQKLQKRLLRKGIQPQQGDTISHYCHRAIDQYPSLKAPLTRIKRELEFLFYECATDIHGSKDPRVKESLRVINQQLKQV